MFAELNLLLKKNGNENKVQLYCLQYNNLLKYVFLFTDTLAR